MKNGRVPLAQLQGLEQRLSEIEKELAVQSDRGCVLVGAAVIEKLLEDLLLKGLPRKEPGTEEKLFNGPTSLLSSFAAKIDMAYLLDLIPKPAQDDLHRMRRIRNDFAHSFEPLSLEDSSFRDRLAELNIYRHPSVAPPGTPAGRHHFTEATKNIMTHLLWSTIPGFSAPPPWPTKSQPEGQSKKQAPNRRD